MNNFSVQVNDLEYSITPQIEFGELFYKVETGCDFMFSLYANDNEEWLIKESDVKPLQIHLVNAIGNAIDCYYAEQ